VTSSPPSGEFEKEWQQPDFQGDVAPPAPLEGPVYSASGSQVAPYTPPSVAETVLSTVSGLVWPVMILLAIMGRISWVPAIIVAIATSVITDNVKKHLRARRKALSRGAVPERDERNDLR
jgi:hypothetical protein